MEEGGGRFVGFQLIGVNGGEVAGLFFIRVTAQFFGIAPGKFLQSGRLHESKLREFTDTLDIDDAPDAFGFARGKADGVADFVEAVPHAIDPAETKGFIQGLGVGDADFAGVLFIKAEAQFGCRGVMGLEPLAEFSGKFEERDFHCRLRGLITNKFLNRGNPYNFL
ncbi:MAG: hypothetical protein JWR19_2680 [Pedosphaera sp.]|nr:hypothetical protein [Pedosphaera sp.]